ncbi:MAG: histidine kinase dimerization/phospho-acceptor domain-containing protein [Acutalibacteraceae bacterium]
MSKLSALSTKNLGLRNRLLLQTVSIALALITIILIVNYTCTDKIFIRKAKNDILSVAEEIKKYDLYSDDFYNDIAEFESKNNMYIEIYILPDLLIYSTNINGSLYIFGGEEEQAQPKEKVLKTIDKPEFNDDGSFFDKKKEMNGTAKYLVYNDTFNDLFAIKIYDSLDVIESNANLTKEFITVLCCSLFVIVLFICILYQNNLTKPLMHINKVTKKIAALDFSEHCPEYVIPELNELGKNINYLSSALDMSLTDLKEKNDRLENDIIKEQQLDKARSEFISNASHELKTPIAIIQGYAEGIKVGIADGEASEEYCDIIIEEADKMNNLVLRLLEISQYESGLYRLQKTRFNIAYAVESFLKPRVMLLKEKGITLCFNINPEYIGYGDVAKIDNVLNNYVSNAISHVDGIGLILVTCSPAADDKYRVSVFNTGKTIKDEDIDKIWMSFYRADKSHSRAAGRFGLGLSFVSSIQEMHGNKYGVINRENGVEFWFDISKAHDFEDDEEG